MSVVSPPDRLAGAWNSSAVHSSSSEPLEQTGAKVMDYLVDFTMTVPEGAPASEVQQRTTGEGTRVAELAAQGHALRVWKPLPDDGRSRAIGLYRAADDRELHSILESLPLRPWMEISVTALAEHPNDPALSSAPAS